MECGEERLHSRDHFNYPSGACGWPGWAVGKKKREATRLKMREKLSGVSKSRSCSLNSFVRSSLTSLGLIWLICKMRIIQGYCKEQMS